MRFLVWPSLHTSFLEREKVSEKEREKGREGERKMATGRKWKRVCLKERKGEREVEGENMWKREREREIRECRFVCERGREREWKRESE